MNASTFAMLLAQLLSIVGSAVSAVAIPWLLLEAGIDIEKIALVFAAQAGAAIFAAVIGTPFLDRFDKRRIHIGCDLILAGGVFALIALYLSGALTPARVAAILAVTAIVAELAGAAGSALVPELADTGRFGKERINGVLGAFYNLADMVGPILGGLVIAGFGVIGALSIDGVSFLLSAALLLCFVRLRPRSSAERAETPASSLAHTYLEGVLTLGRDPTLRTVTVVSAAINMVITVLLVLLLPVLVKSGGGDAVEVGVLISCFGCGALAASMFYVWKSTALPPLYAMFASVSLALLALALIPQASGHFVYPLLLVIGLCVGYLGPLEKTLVQDHSPEHAIGRIMLAYSALRTVLVPAGFLIVGRALADAGPERAFMALALLLVAPALLLGYRLARSSQGTMRDARR